MVNSFNAYQGKNEKPSHKSEKLWNKKIIVIKEVMRKVYLVHLLHFLRGEHLIRDKH
jgi:hypothetical protein